MSPKRTISSLPVVAAVEVASVVVEVPAGS
jgi:hypothetical protein